MTTRRDFLQTITASASLLTLPHVTHSNPTVPYNGPKLRVALMGLGGYATIVATALEKCEKAVLTAIVTGTPKKAEDWKKKYKLSDKNIYNYDNVEQIKNNKDIDIVYITTPNSLHYKHVLQIAKTGKNIICEKPLADNAKQAKEMIEVCKKANVKLYVGYRLHFEPYTKELIRMRTSGELGKILHVNTHMGFKIGDPTQWRLRKALSGGGAIMDVGIYAINGARYATGEEPIWVTAQESKTDPEKFAEVDETVMFQLGFPSGIIASCGTTYAYNHYDRLYVIGEKGFVELSPAYGYGPLKGRSHKGEMNQPVIMHQVNQMEGLADIILNNKPDPQITGEEGLRDMKVVDAIYESLRKNGARISIA